MFSDFLCRHVINKVFHEVFCEVSHDLWTTAVSIRCRISKYFIEKYFLWIKHGIEVLFCLKQIDIEVRIGALLEAQWKKNSLDSFSTLSEL